MNTILHSGYSRVKVILVYLFIYLQSTPLLATIAQCLKIVFRL